MTDEQKSLESGMNAARKKLDAAAGKSATGIESSYGEAYQRLVRAGLRPQLKRKYR